MIINSFKKLPIVMLHGFMGTTFAHFGKAIKHWYGKFPIVGIDLPGHGHCARDGQVHYYEDAIEYVISKIQEYEKVYLIGVSYLGGTIALKVAERKKNLIEKLVITGFTYDVPKKSFCAWANNFIELVKHNTPLAEEYYRLHGEKWVNTLDLVIKDINNSYEEVIQVSTNFLKKLSIPTLLINGDYKDSELNAARKFSNISIYLSSKVVEGSGHIVQYDKPTEFCTYIESFIGCN